MNTRDINISILVGQTIVYVEGDGSPIKTAEGNTYGLRHQQSCCESVDYIRTDGNIVDLLNTPVLEAYSDHPSDCPGYPVKNRFVESHTWSRFYIRTAAGEVTFWYLGQSNGYYGETMDFFQCS